MEGMAYRNGLIIGVAGAVLTMLGDFLLGANSAAAFSTGSPMLDAFVDGVGNSDARIVAGGMLGAIGIPITGVGYFRIHEALISGQGGFMPFVYKVAALAFTGLGGGVHLSCAVIPLLYKWIAASDPALAAQVAARYAYDIMLPPTVVFGALLFVALVYQIAVFGRGQTPYPRWALVFNLVFGVIPPYLLALAFGNNVVGNGIATAAISIGHLWMFAGLLAAMPEGMRKRKPRSCE